MSTPDQTPPSGAPSPAEQPSRGATAGLFVAGTTSLVVAVVAVVLLAGMRHKAEAAELSARETELSRGPRVRVAAVQESEGTRTVSLPGEAHAWAASNIHAKVAGYLQSITPDKGDWVQQGSIIARIESPEIDQQVHVAEADLQLRKLTADRLKGLLAGGFVAKQEVDNAETLLRQAEAALSSARTMQQYEVIRAPFSGTITARYVDPGALLPAATGTTTAAQPVVEISNLDKLRIYVYLAQNDAALVKIGDEVHISMDQRPEVGIDARVSRISRSLDPRTRTMLVEVDIDNRKTNIYPGEFLHVSLQLRARPYPLVPVEALIPKSQKFFVAVVEDNKARLAAVETGNDNGDTVQIVSGVKAGDLVALNAADEIQDGSPLQPITDEKKATSVTR